MATNMTAACLDPNEEKMKGKVRSRMMFALVSAAFWPPHAGGKLQLFIFFSSLDAISSPAMTKWLPI
jgi:CII-binding regulator of phage lambda lysogenization HflD